MYFYFNGDSYANTVSLNVRRTEVVAGANDDTEAPLKTQKRNLIEQDLECSFETGDHNLRSKIQQENTQCDLIQFELGADVDEKIADNSTEKTK